MSLAFVATKIRHFLKSKLNVWNWHKNICCCSVTQSCPTLYDHWTAACQASPSFTISQSLLKLMSIELMMPSNHLILCYPLLTPSIFPSIRVFSSESALHIRWQSIGVSASVHSMNIQDWFPLGLTCLISLQCKGLSRVFFSMTIWKHEFFRTQPSLWSNSHICLWPLENL